MLIDSTKHLDTSHPNRVLVSALYEGLYRRAPSTDSRFGVLRALGLRFRAVEFRVELWGPQRFRLGLGTWAGHNYAYLRKPEHCLCVSPAASK